MRFMVMHKNDAATEACEPPGAALIEKMGAFIGEHAEKGQFLGGEGLGASSTRTRITFRGGKPTVKHGPYTGVNELVGSVMLLKVRSREEAIGWAERYGKILVDGEVELGPVTEEWDLGLAPRPADAPLRILMLHKADAASEAGQERSPRQKADLTRLKTEMTRAGVLLASETLQPSSRGKRLLFNRSALRVIDGPFSESKELVGGYSILKLPSMDAVIEECKRFADIVGGTAEIDVRPLVEPEESA
jgi:hypothetical protein